MSHYTIVGPGKPLYGLDCRNCGLQVIQARDVDKATCPECRRSGCHVGELGLVALHPDGRWLAYECPKCRHRTGINPALVRFGTNEVPDETRVCGSLGCEGLMERTSWTWWEER